MLRVDGLLARISNEFSFPQSEHTQIINIQLIADVQELMDDQFSDKHCVNLSSLNRQDKINE
jgi:hypothetical protein